MLLFSVPSNTSNSYSKQYIAYNDCNQVKIFHFYILCNLSTTFISDIQYIRTIFIKIGIILNCETIKTFF